ncbi:MAG: hypothetical protein NT014_06405 [Candidatus Omnitrophica bacterium]|nr:hypothetical protein [Candidatus Omnitrophota bacterium]
MHYKITYTDLTDLLMVITEGQMNSRDFIAMAEDLLCHSRFLPGANVIFDHTALEFSNVFVDDLQKIRAFHMANEERIGGGKSAIVVKAGLSGEWHKLWSQGEKIKTENKEQVFENCCDALNWLKGDK